MREATPDDEVRSSDAYEQSGNIACMSAISSRKKCMTAHHECKNLRKKRLQALEDIDF
jgi:hypothetical protein